MIASVDEDNGKLLEQRYYIDVNKCIFNVSNLSLRCFSDDNKKIEVSINLFNICFSNFQL